MEKFLITMAIIYLAIGVFCAAANRRYWKIQAHRYPKFANYLQDQWVDFVFEILVQPAEIAFSASGRRSFFIRLGTDGPAANVFDIVRQNTHDDICLGRADFLGIHEGQVGRHSEYVTCCKRCEEVFPLAQAGYVPAYIAGPLCPQCYDTLANTAPANFMASGLP